jgi:hypothetical protein
MLHETRRVRVVTLDDPPPTQTQFASCGDERLAALRLRYRRWRVDLARLTAYCDGRLAELDRELATRAGAAEGKGAPR